MKILHGFGFSALKGNTERDGKGGSGQLLLTWEVSLESMVVLCVRLPRIFFK